MAVPTYRFRFYPKEAPDLPVPNVEVVFFTPWDEVDQEKAILTFSPVEEDVFLRWYNTSFDTHGYFANAFNMSPRSLWCVTVNESNSCPYIMKVEGDIPSDYMGDGDEEEEE